MPPAASLKTAGGIFMFSLFGIKTHSRNRVALSQIYSLLATRPRSSFHSVFPSQRSSAKSAAGSHM